MGKQVVYEELKSPVTAQIETTYRCTSLCNYCYNSWRGREKLPKTSLSKNDSLVIAKKLVGGELFEVVLTGGEPLLRRDVVYPCAQYLSSNNVDVGLNTNLILFNEDDCQRIKDAGISRVFASLSSSEEELYNNITKTRAFKRVLHGLEKVVSHNIPIGVNMVVTQMNKHQVYDVGKLLHDYGIRFFSATPASPCEFMPRELELNKDEVLKTLDDLIRVSQDFGISVDVVEPIPRCITNDSEKYEQFFKRDCAAGKSTIAISPSGNVRPCTHISKEYGSLITEELPEIWDRMRPWRKGNYIPLECLDCGEENICSFGCREAARMETGKYNGMEPWAAGSVKTSREKIRVSSVPEDTELKVIPNLRFRQEAKGYLVFSPRDHSMIYANEPLFKVLSSLSKRERFTIEGIRKETGGSGFPNIIKYLNARRLIEKWS